MSTIPPLFNDEVLAWDRYAAAALSTTIKQSKTVEEAAVTAAEFADRLVKEREKRIKAAKEHLFQH